MNHNIDLDAVAEAIRPLLTSLGEETEVSPLTWRDEQAPWPQPITTDREAVASPESLGFMLRRHGDEAEFVAWTVGWADQDIFVRGRLSQSCPEFESVRECVKAIDVLLKEWVRSAQV